MTDKTPLEEFFDAVGITIMPPPSRPDTLKAMWEQLVTLYPEHAANAMEADGASDGVIVRTNDPWDVAGVVEFERKTYNGKSVIEAEGVIVCHLIG